MKKILFMIAFFIILACEKEEDFCWNCQKSVYIPGAMYSAIVEVCSMTESEIKQFEKDNSLLEGTTTIHMGCWKKGTTKPSI